MTLMQTIVDEMKKAMKAGEKLRLETLRLLRAQLQEKEISKRGVAEMTSEDELAVLRNAVKKRKESIEQFEKGGRFDLANRERKELEIVQSFLPQEVSRAEVEDVLRKAIQEMGANSLQDLGKVMSVVMKAFKGRADGKLVQEIAKSMLSSST